MVKTTKNKKKTANFAKRAWKVICYPFQKLWTWICSAWNWIAGINLVALLNLALLISIIVLFTLLIIDLRKSANANNVEIITQPAKIENIVSEQKPVLKPRPMTKVTKLPIKRDEITRKYKSAPITVAKIKQNPVAIKQVALQPKTNIAWGDIIVDHHDMTKVLSNGTHIHGNLYIQDLRKYTLPCDIVVDGNLILRDVNILNFCGDFTVRGNIYVNPRSSFGPVPSTARIGGQVIL